MSDAVIVAVIGAVGLIMSGVLVELVRARKRQDTVVHEMQPNSGGSLRDAVNRVATHLNSVDDKVDGLAERLVRVETLNEVHLNLNRGSHG